MISHVVVVRAFTKDGYHKDIAMLSEQQVHMHDLRVPDSAPASMSSGLIGVGISIDPTKFPEVVKFEIVIRESNK